MRAAPSSPRASGLARVRAIFASTLRSIRQLKANPEAASSDIPAVADTRIVHGTLSVLASSMPISAQNAASSTIRGLVSARYCNAVWRQSLAEVVWTCIVCSGAEAALPTSARLQRQAGSNAG